MLDVPIIANDRVVGLIGLDDPRTSTRSATPTSVSSRRSRPASASRSRTHASSGRSNGGRRESDALAEVGRELSSTLDLPTVLERVARSALDLLAADASAIFLPADGEGAYRAATALGDGRR